MTRVFLAAGVAALAIAAPASAGPHGGRGGGGGQQAFVNHGGGGGQRAQAGGRRGGGGFAAPRMQRMSAPRMQRMNFAMQRPQRAQHAQAHQQHGGRAQARMAARQQPHGHAQAQHRMAARQQPHGNGHGQAQQRMAARQQAHGNGHAQAQQRMAARQQMRGHGQAQQRMAARQQMRGNQQAMRANRMQQAQQMRANGMQQVHGRMAQQQQRQQLRAERMAAIQKNLPANVQFAGRNAAGPGRGQAMLQGLRSMPVQNRMVALRDMGSARFTPVDIVSQRNIFAPAVAGALVGVPLAAATTLGTFNALPQGIGYLYPATPNYYYQYGNGYVYQVDRGSNLIDALFPLLAGGYLPGTYLPAAYMSSYVPDYYGFNSFYPATYDYGYGYGNVCNRYAYGVVYQVDCYSGMVENVIPMYAGGYGVGQILPSAYNYYNVPMQYRSMYYPTADYSYWYAPGAIYQYNPSTSLITSVAALMAPGFAIGQPLPAGYGMYNVPMAYRATYYDTPNAWYRYNNGYIYQINPATQLVTAIVASLLT